MVAANLKKGIVFDLQRFTIHDGPGIRTQVFLKKCPLRCVWCSNPESMKGKLELGVFPDKCIGTDKAVCLCDNVPKCVDACMTMFKKMSMAEAKRGKAPETGIRCALIVEDCKVSRKDRNICIDCLECVKVCPSDALMAFGKQMTVEEVMKELERDREFYVESGGGITLAGGDPLAQPEFTLEVLKESKERGIHTCLETEGHARWAIIEKILPYVDMWLYDIKHMDSEKHKEYTGVGNELILENLKKLASRGASLIIKTPVVPGHNDSEENIEATAKFIKGLDLAVKQYQLLPYFSFMRSKYEALGMEYTLPLKGPTKEKLTELCDLARSHGAPAVIGAYSEIEVS